MSRTQLALLEPRDYVNKATRNCAFSLVEVTLALGVAAACLLTIFGLLPVGIQCNQSVIEQTAGASIARAIIADLRITPLTSGTSPQFGFILLTGEAPQALYFSEDGSSSPTPWSSGIEPVLRYRSTIWLSSAQGKQATPVRLLITWPALADPDPKVAPKNYAGSFEILTAIDRN